MADRAPEVARFLAEEVALPHMPWPATWVLVSRLRKRWPDLTEGEFDRAFLIAVEMKAAAYAEHEGRRP